MSSEKVKAVTLGTMGNKNISQEPEMKELKRMIRDGELEAGRTLEHVREKSGGGGEGRGVVSVPELSH